MTLVDELALASGAVPLPDSAIRRPGEDVQVLHRHRGYVTGMTPVKRHDLVLGILEFKVHLSFLKEQLERANFYVSLIDI